MESKLLKYITASEIIKSKKTALLSERVIITFLKIAEGRSLEMKKYAIDKYNEAKETKKKISTFTLKTEKQVVKDIVQKELEQPFKATKSIVHDLNISKKNNNFLDKIFSASMKHHIGDIKKYLNVLKQFKVKLSIKVRFEKPSINDMVQFDDDDLNSKIPVSEHIDYLRIVENYKITSAIEIEELEKDYRRHAYDALEALQIQGSSWAIMEAISCTTTFFKNKNFKKGASYIDVITPAKSGLINIHNADNECLKWCLLFHQSNKGKNDNRTTALLKIKDKYNWNNISFPVSLRDLDKVEENNENIVINVLDLDRKFLRKSKAKGHDIINLVLVENETTAHYIYIKNISYFLKASHDNEGVVCPICLRIFTLKQFEKHVASKCSEEGYITKITYPFNKKRLLNETLFGLPPPELENEDIDKKMEMDLKRFKRIDNKPFVLFADFEANCQKSNDEKYIHKHEPNSYAVKLVCNFDEKYSMNIILYRGINVVKNFIQTLLNLNQYCQKIIDELREKNKLPKLTDDEEITFKNQNSCWICEENFTEKSGKVRDHCHYTGKFRGGACNICNLNFTHLKTNKKGEVKATMHTLPVVFHNLRGYDGHFIIQEASYYTDNIKPIMQSFEKYMTFEFMRLKFIDSMNFMNTSLEKLADNLIIKEEQQPNFIGPLNHDYSNFIHFSKYFKSKTSLIARKGLYPYEFAQNKNDFKLKGLPSQNQFYSSLSNKTPTDIEYANALNVYDVMQCKNFGDYHDLYLKTDVLLLADIFCKFRATIKKNYRFEILNYISLPSLSLDAMLNICRQPLGLIYDDDTRIFFTENIRGGIVQAGAKRHATANNKYMQSYDPQKESTFISYLDMNSLYGTAMTQPIPYKLLDEVDLKLEDILNQPNDAEVGYFVKCDIHVPNELHPKFKQYPLCPVSSNIGTLSLSPYQIETLKKNKMKHNDKSKKLILDLHDKKDYVAHYVYIKKIVELGYKVEVKQVIPFKQSIWLADYINKNTELRKDGKNEFEKDVFKLMSNAIYGKLMENVLGRLDLKIFKSETKAIKHMTYDNFKDADYLNDLFFIQAKPEEVKYDKPSYIGNAILDISKVLMIDFHYNYMVPKYGDDAELLYTDTDSFVYFIKTDDLYQDMYDNKEFFDLSDVKIKKFHDKTNKKTLGKMKCETGMIPIIEFCANGPKSYSIIIDKFQKFVNSDGITCNSDKLENKKTCKGVQRSVLKDSITHADYVNTLKTGYKLVKPQTTIRSQKHQLYTMKFNKVCLSSFDDKVYRVNYNEGYPYGYNPK